MALPFRVFGVWRASSWQSVPPVCCYSNSGRRSLDSSGDACDCCGMKHGLFGLCVLWLLAGCGGEAGEEGTAVPATVPVVLVEVPDLVGESTEYDQGAADVAGLVLAIMVERSS